MRGREGKGGAPPTDLLVCFPSRTHLALMPKPVSNSPARTSTEKRHHHQKHQLGRFKNKVGHHGSPILWAKTKSMESAEMDEPTSPKVTCAGQIKVKSKSNSCKNWQSVMEEIERLHHHNNSKHKKKKQTWVEALGLKKDVMQVLSCLRGFRVQIPCFSSFHQTVLSSDDEEDQDEDEDEDDDQYCQNDDQVHHHQLGDDHGDASGSSENVLSKWFMVVEENQEQHEDQNKNDSCAPPPNALLLMRCRSAPAKTWLEEQQLQEQQQEKEEAEAAAKKAKLVLEQNQQKNQENIILKYYAAPDFFKVSSDIAKETWVVGGGARDPLARSRSWKR